MSSASHDQSGFTLLEVVIAILIFTFCILAFSGMQIVGRNSIAHALRGSKTCSRAASQIEAILSMAYNDPQLLDLNTGYYPDRVDHGPLYLFEDRSSIEWEVDDDFPIVGCKRITITVRNQAPGGARKIFSYDYIKAKGGL